MSGTTKTIKTGASNKFNDLTVSGSAATISDNDVEIGGVLTASGTLTVAAGDQLTFTGSSKAHIIDGTLTVNTSSGVNSILDFTGSTSNTIVVSNGGTLNLDGTGNGGDNSAGRVFLTGDADSRVDLEFPSTGTNDGLFDGDHFTVSFPVAAGIKINSDAAHQMNNGFFKNPTSGGVLLNFESASTLPTTIDSCSFNGNSGVDKNASANANTDPVTFINYAGGLADDATVAEANDNDNDSRDFPLRSSINIIQNPFGSLWNIQFFPFTTSSVHCKLSLHFFTNVCSWLSEKNKN